MRGFFFNRILSLTISLMRLSLSSSFETSLFILSKATFPLNLYINYSLFIVHYKLYINSRALKYLPQLDINFEVNNISTSLFLFTNIPGDVMEKICFGRFLYSLLIAFFAFTISVSSQTSVKGNSQEIKEVILNSNQVTTVLYNYGSICKPNTLSYVADFVWRDLGYMFEFGPLVAAKVVNNNGDTMRIVDDSFILPSQGSYSSDGTEKWGWLPRTGYTNPNSPFVATANDPSSWPTSWTGWNGELGNGITIGNDEAFYVIDDFTNREFSYYPFPNDTTKRGLGLKSEVRIYQFDNIFKNSIVVKYFLTNESSKNLDEVYFGFFGDPHIGGANNYSDDRVTLINLGDNNVSSNNYSVCLFDADGMGDGGRPTGYMGFRFLETPGKQGMTSFNPAMFGSVFPKDDAVMWQWLSGGIDTINSVYHNPGDNIISFGTGSFSLAAGETKTISIVVSVSENFEKFIQDAKLFPYHYYFPEIETQIGSSGGDENYHVSLTFPVEGTLNGTVPVQWDYTGTNPDAQVFIDCSSDNGRNWQYVATAPAADETYNWNTENNKDGVNYILRTTAFTPDTAFKYYYSLSSSLITINNPVNAQPEVELNINFAGTTITDPSADVLWNIADADNSTLNVSLAYAASAEGPWNEITTGAYSTGNFNYNWDVTQLATMPVCFLKLTASDGQLDSTVISPSFAVNYAVASFQPSNILHLSGLATADINIEVSDSSALIDDTYDLSFTGVSGAAVNLSVKNVNTGALLVENLPVIRGSSTPVFNGIKLLIDNKTTAVNNQKTRFNRAALDTTYKITFPPIAGNPKIPVPNDWAIIFNDMTTDLSGNYLYPADTVISNLGNVKIITPFKIVNTTYNEPGEYIIFVSTGVQNLSAWNTSQRIILRPQNPVGATTTYQVKFNFDEVVKPQNGDTLFIITDKALTAEDNYRFSVNPNVVLPVEQKELLPGNFALFQNYPNPFNPSTTIKYSLAEGGRVIIKIFDILGKEVITLTDEYKDAGYYEIDFRAENLSSGIYFYKIASGSFSETKKMVLLR